MRVLIAAQVKVSDVCAHVWPVDGQLNLLSHLWCQVSWFNAPSDVCLKCLSAYLINAEFKSVSLSVDCAARR